MFCNSKLFIHYRMFDQFAYISIRCFIAEFYGHDLIGMRCFTQVLFIRLIFQVIHFPRNSLFTPTGITSYKAVTV